MEVMSFLLGAYDNDDDIPESNEYIICLMHSPWEEAQTENLKLLEVEGAPL